MAMMNTSPSSQPTRGLESKSKLLYDHIHDSSTTTTESSAVAKDGSSAKSTKDKDIIPAADHASSETAGKSPNAALHKKTKSNSSTKKAPKFNKITGELLIAKMTAWQEARRAEINTRYQHEETRIQAWEEHVKAKASIKLRSEEMRLEHRRLKVVADTEKEVARTHRKSQDLKQAVYAKKELELAQLSAEAENLMETGKIASGCMNM